MADNDLAASTLATARAVGCELSDSQGARLVDYARLVCRWQRVMNLTGARDPAQFIAGHVADCVAVAPHLPAGRLLDAGSGAGLPGIVLAIVRPDLQVTLLEPRARRARFLTQARIELELNNVEIANERLQTHTPAAAYAAVVTRAFGSLDEFVAAAAAHVASGARLFAMKAGVSADDLAAAEARAGAAQIIALTVPGFRERSLVVFGPRAQAVVP